VVPDRPLLALVGPTACGKTELGVSLAGALGAEIVSIDSMLVYRAMDIGTAKPTREQRRRVRHHLIDIAEPAETFSVARFQEASRAAVNRIATAGRVPLLVGGSGLYFRAVVDDLEFPGTDPAMRADLERQAEALGAARLYARLATLDPVAAGRIEPGNVRRTVRALEVAAITGRPFSSFGHAWKVFGGDRVRVAGVRMPRAVLAGRIERRVRAMLDAGWLDEVHGLVERGFGGWLTSTQAIGYADLARHLRGQLSIDEAVEATVRRTGALARRQIAWFRRDPRVRWFDVGPGGASDDADAIRAYLEDG
jgi:tRNA dimethylallyltransferase